jgi:hypothetical protein
MLPFLCPLMGAAIFRFILHDQSLPTGARHAGGVRNGPGGESQGGEEVAGAPVLPSDVAQEAIPGNIRNAELFLRFMKQVVMYLKIKIQAGKYQVESATPTAFQHAMSKVSTD